MTFYGTPASGAEGFKRHPIGAGPYRFVAFRPGVALTLEAFAGYWRKVPAVKSLAPRVIPDEAARLAALKRGEVDMAYGITRALAGVFETAFLDGVGPGVDNHSLNVIPGFAYSALYEDLRLKKK